MLRLCACLLAVLLAGHVFAGTPVKARASYQDVKLIGFTRPQAVINLIAEEQGRFESIDVHIGDTIGAARRFGCLDSTYIDLKLAANRAQQQRLQADLDYYRKQVERFSDLVSRNTTARSELDNLQRQKTGTEAQLQETDIVYSELQEHKRRHCIEASEGWRVVDRQVDPGQWVNVGDRVGAIADFSVLLVPYALSYQEFQALKAAGDSLAVRLVDEQLEVSARPVHINPDFNEDTRKISLELAIEEGPPEMRGGLRVELGLSVPDPSGALLVPMPSLQERFEQFWVQLPDKSELPVVYLGQVEVEGEKWGRVVSRQLKAGDTVLVPD